MIKHWTFCERGLAWAYSSFSCSQVFGCHSLAKRWVSATCEAVIFSASESLADRESASASFPGFIREAAKLIHLWAWT